jgi:hypothetical protein
MVDLAAWRELCTCGQQQPARPGEGRRSAAWWTGRHGVSSVPVGSSSQPGQEKEAGQLHGGLGGMASALYLWAAAASPARRRTPVSCMVDLADLTIFSPKERSLRCFSQQNQRRYFKTSKESKDRVLEIDSVSLCSQRWNLEQSMGARNRVGIGLSYRPTRLHRLSESIPGFLKS